MRKMVLVSTIATLIGLYIVHLELWDQLEPVLGMGSLVFAIWATLEARLAKKAVEQHSTMPLERFTITVGLREGYVEGALHSAEEVRDLFQSWIALRIHEGKRFITGMVDATFLVYPVRNGEDGWRTVSEPSCEISGTLSAKYDKDRSDEEVSQTLSEFALFLGKALKQKRVYLSYCSQQWVIDIPE